MQAKEGMLTNETFEPYSTKFGGLATIAQDNQNSSFGRYNNRKSSAIKQKSGKPSGLGRYGNDEVGHKLVSRSQLKHQPQIRNGDRSLIV